MPPLTLMIKPASSLCNMRCAYCFYRDVSEHREEASYGLMDEATLETLVRRAFAYADDAVHFAFQGGEPTMAGLPFYQKLMALQRRYNTRGLAVHNAIQTNGLLIDDAFAAFLGEHRFLVGLSLDGCEQVHDALRWDARGEGTYARVTQAAGRLTAHGVQFNILCVVTAQVAARPGETFDALAPFSFMQFIPCLDGFDSAPDAYSLTADAYGHFLCEVFDRYERAYQRGRPISVRDFDNYLQMIAGYPPESCAMRGTCGRYYLVEADGGVYPCDFYVLDEWRLGNIRDDSFARLARSPVAERFVQMSVAKPEPCGACEWLPLCRGGCKREREPFVGDVPSPHRLCGAYRQLFAYAYGRMRAMSQSLLAR